MKKITTPRRYSHPGAQSGHVVSEATFYIAIALLAIMVVVPLAIATFAM